MKKMLVFVLLLVASSISAQDYDYLKVTLVNGKKCLNIRAKALSLGKNFLETTPVKTVNFQEFLNDEPGITKPEGFFLCEELENWQKKSDHESPLTFLEKRNAHRTAQLAETVAVCLFGDSLKELKRDQFILLWIGLSRKAVKNNHRNLKSNFSEESWRIAQIAEEVWISMPKSWTVENMRAFALSYPDKVSVNLLVDAGDNIMTKIILFPEIYYEKKEFSYDLVNKSSKDLKDYAVYK